MHPRNQLRLLAGLTIDPSLEHVNEAREVPNRKDVAVANETNLKKKLASCEKACAHLQNAVKALEAAPATDTDATIPQMIKDIEELCGELSTLCKSISKVKPIKESTLNEDHFSKGTCLEDSKGHCWEVVGFEGEGDDETYHLKCSTSGKKVDKKYKTIKNWKKVDKKNLKENEMEPSSPAHAQDFRPGEKVLFDNGIWVVHVADPQADVVGVIPPSMVKASNEEKAKAMQQVKREKLRKPSEEETKIMAGPDGVLGTEDDVRLESSVTESTLNYTKSNAVSFEDNDEDPVNSVAQGKGNWANSLNQTPVKNEYTTQLDNRGDASMTDYETKVKVPPSIKKALKDAITSFETEIKKFEGRGGHTAQETFNMYTDTKDAFKKLLGLLDKGTVEGMKEAQTFASSLMGPMLHKIPNDVWKFIANGGQKRSLKDYMNPVKDSK